jgi:hypothetical protein
MTPDSPGSNGPGESPMVLHQVIDRRHNGVVAWAFQHPPGWQARSDVVWNLEHMSFPVISFAQAFNPQGAELVEVLPSESFCWLEPDYGMYPQGQNVLGQISLPPMPAVDALVRWVIPRYRGNRGDFRIVEAGPMPGLVEQLGVDLKGVPGEGARARVEYTENGTPVEEEFYGISVLQRVPYHGPMGTMIQINWGFARLFTFRAARGELEARRELFWRIVRSGKVNPLWEQLCAQVMQQLQEQFNQYIQMGYSQIQAAGQMSRAISANNDAMLSAFEGQRLAAAQSSRAARASASSDDSSSDSFSEYIRGVETYDDPYWGESQQDSDYDYHWTDGQGNYQQSNDPFFNPNIGSNQNWSLMEAK